MEDGTVELKRSWRLFLAWWWLLALGALGPAALAYYVSDSAIPIYQSRAKVVVERNQLPGAPSLGDIIISQDLAQNYVDLIETRPVLEQVTEELPVRYTPDQLRSKISIKSIRNIIEITASDANPQLAAIIANGTADTFIRVLRDRQLSQLAQFQRVLTEYGIQQDDSIVAAQAAMLGVLSIIEPAFPDPRASNDDTFRNVMVAAAAGIILSALGILLIGYLDDRIKSPGDLKAATGLTWLGSIQRFRSDRQPSLEGPAQSDPVVESYRSAKTNLEFASPEAGLKSLLVTSPGVSEGKTTTAIHLAALAARDGQRVVVVDSNLRSPSLHEVFDARESPGLAEVLAGSATVEEALAPTSVDGLCLVPAGLERPELHTVLSSPDMRRVVQELEEKSDLVIFDSPSLLAVGDASLLARLVDGVLLVVDTGRTSREALENGIERLSQTKAQVVGAILNKVAGNGPGERYLGHYLDRNGGASLWQRYGALSSMRVLSGILLGSILLAVAIVLLVAGPQNISGWSP